MNWEGLSGFLGHNWGNLASVAGLFVSAATLAVATKAREAAEAAKAVARRQSLTEILQDTVRKNEQVGLFLSQQKWDIVWLRAQEVASAASLGLTRWALELNVSSRDNLLKSQRLSNAIAAVALRAASEPPASRDVSRISIAQGRVEQSLNEALGDSVRRVEGGG